MVDLEKYILDRELFNKLPDEKELIDKTIIITGAAGTICREIIFKIIDSKIKVNRLILIDHNDSELLNVVRICRKKGSKTEVIPMLGSIIDKSLLEYAIKTYSPDIIIHGAAFKIVPMVEQNPLSAVQNNVIATANIFHLAGENQIPKVIFISSYEAYEPKNVFGYTKKAAELLMTLYAKKYTNTQYNAIRFGFVLLSTGSVAHVFKAQAIKNENLTVSHVDVERYICSTSEAVYSTLSLLSACGSGKVFTIDMGSPIKIIDIANKFISYYKSKSKIEAIGLRPGDKLFEAKLGGELGLADSGIDGLFLTLIPEIDVSKLETRYNNLLRCMSEDYNKINQSLIELCKGE